MKNNITFFSFNRFHKQSFFPNISSEAAARSLKNIEKFLEATTHLLQHQEISAALFLSEAVAQSSRFLHKIYLEAAAQIFSWFLHKMY